VSCHNGPHARAAARRRRRGAGGARRGGGRRAGGGAARAGAGAGARGAPPPPDDPSAHRADLVVCNLPTHASRDATETLVASLARLADDARVLVVVHASLEGRFAELFAGTGARATTEALAEHVVLGVSR
jgi:hypothetical protein